MQYIQFVIDVIFAVSDRFDAIILKYLEITSQRMDLHFLIQQLIQLIYLLPSLSHSFSIQRPLVYEVDLISFIKDHRNLFLRRIYGLSNLWHHPLSYQISWRDLSSKDVS